MATEGAVKLFDKYGVVTQDDQQDGALFGMLGPSRTADALPVSSLIGSLPANQRVLQISGSSTGRQLSDHSTYPGFFRVIPPDQIQVKVILELMLQLQWNYVAIVYDDDDYGRSAATELRRLAESHQVCVPVFSSVPLDARSSAFLERANDISEQLRSSENGLVRGLVILGMTSTTQHLLRSLNSQVTYVRVILSEAVVLNRATLLTPSGQVPVVSAGALVTSPPYIHIPELRPLWNDLWSDRTVFLQQTAKIPWLDEYFTQITSCATANDTNCWEQAHAKRNSQQVLTDAEISLFAGYRVKAIAVMAVLMKHLQDETCGSSFSGLCTELKSAINQRVDVVRTLEQSTLDLRSLSNISDAFDSSSTVKFNSTSGDILSDRTVGDYTVYNFRRSHQGGQFSFEQIGSWLNHNLSINKSEAQFYNESLSALTWWQTPPAQCDVNHDCVMCERDVSQDVIFLEGDFYVVAVLPVNEENQADPLSCGAIRTVIGADIVQSVVFAVEEVNKKHGEFRHVLPGRKVGLVVFNSCDRPLLVRKRLIDFHSGTLRLSDSTNSSSILRNIMGYVGAIFSSDSIALAETLQDLNKTFVQISGASTAPDLSNKEKYPYFLRLVPSDIKQTQVLLDIVHHVGAKYIQVIYDNSIAYATEVFRKLQVDVGASNSRYNICIAQVIPITPQKEVSQFIWVKDQLREKSQAKIVIVVLRPSEIKKVLDAILPGLKNGEFVFIGTEGWGRRKDLLQGTAREKLAGSLVLSVEAASSQPFQRDLGTMDPTRSVNPWLKYFWEASEKCYFNKSFLRRGKAGQCPADVAEFYSQDTLVPFHINAVYALALGFSSALTQRCSSPATRVCSSLTSSDLFSAMLEVKLDLCGTGNRSQVFDSNGDGLVGYTVLQIMPDVETSSEQVVYRDVGYWRHNKLNIIKENFTLPGGPHLNSICVAGECRACFQRHNTSGVDDVPTSNEDGRNHTSPSGLIGAVVALTFIVVVLIVVVVILYFYARRRYRQAATIKTQVALETAAPSTNVDRSSTVTLVRQEEGPDEDMSPYDLPEGDQDGSPHPSPNPRNRQSIKSDYLTPVTARAALELGHSIVDEVSL